MNPACRAHSYNDNAIATAGTTASGVFLCRLAIAAIPACQDLPPIEATAMLGVSSTQRRLHERTLDVWRLYPPPQPVGRRPDRGRRHHWRRHLAEILHRCPAHQLA